MTVPKTAPLDETVAAPTAPAPHGVELHCTAGRSNKRYVATIVPVDNDPSGWIVVAEWGPIGGGVQTATKTKGTVSWDKAVATYEKLIRSKLAKDYKPVAGGRVVDLVVEGDTGMRPQLANATDGATVERMLRDPDWALEVKYDGVRGMVEIRDGEVVAANRKGRAMPLPAPVREALKAIPFDVDLDGEVVGDRYHVFDIMLEADRNLRQEGQKARRRRLEAMPLRGAVSIAERAEDEAGKRALRERVRRDGGEGVVYKRVDAPYRVDRPSSGGDWLKEKNWEELSAVVSHVNEKRSVAIHLLAGDGSEVPVGNVTIPSNHGVPEAGDVVEVRYLYAFPDGSLYQPTYEKPRPDVTPDECTADQRKFVRRDDARRDAEAPTGPALAA